MSEGLVVNGVEIECSEMEDGSLRVSRLDALGLLAIGTLELAPDGETFTARSPDGTPVTRPSQWGGRVSARFHTRTLAVEALLERAASAE